MTSGQIGQMYVAQLDMYLTKDVDVISKEIKAIGFTRDKKVAFIRKHLLKIDKLTANKLKPVCRKFMIGAISTCSNTRICALIGSNYICL